MKRILAEYELHFSYVVEVYVVGRHKVVEFKDICGEWITFIIE
jgi:hypothetical protein